MSFDVLKVLTAKNKQSIATIDPTMTPTIAQIPWVVDHQQDGSEACVQVFEDGGDAAAAVAVAGEIVADLVSLVPRTTQSVKMQRRDRKEQTNQRWLELRSLR